ncbi:MAG: hypothetical protein R2771_16490 [Saprospiraceae bacterium]
MTFRDVEPKVEKLAMMLEAILNDANSDFFALQEIRDLLKNIKAHSDRGTPIIIFG